MPLNVRPLSPRLQEVARRELHEDPARVEQDVAHIKEWLKKQPHLHARTDDQWLLTFLRGCKFSLERTKEKLDCYYTVRTLLPEYFTNRDPMLPEIQEVLKLGSHLPLPHVDDQGRRLIVGRPGLSDPSKITIEVAIKVNLMIVDIMMMEDDDYITSGDINLLDMAGMGLAHIMQFTPALAKKMSSLLQDAYPTRPKGIHYIHVPSSFLTIFNLFKTFLKEKMLKRLHVHGDDMESLYKELPKKHLPVEYGGHGGSLVEITEIWKKKVESYRDWFLDDEQYSSNEKKRIGKPKTQESMFGLEGSFRQLNVD